MTHALDIIFISIYSSTVARGLLLFLVNYKCQHKKEITLPGATPLEVSLIKACTDQARLSVKYNILNVQLQVHYGQLMPSLEFMKPLLPQGLWLPRCVPTASHCTRLLQHNFQL